MSPSNLTIHSKLKLRKPRQLKLQIKTWGGKRAGAGRPNKSGQVNHMKRERLDGKSPAHITIRLTEGLPSLRQNDLFNEFKNSLTLAKKKGLKVVHYALLGNHIHMIVESYDNKTLSRGMQSFGISFAKAIKRFKKVNDLVAGKSNKSEMKQPIFNGSYHLRIVRTPTEMKRLLQYVLLNPVKHKQVNAYLDKFTTACFFNSWEDLCGRSLGKKLETQRERSFSRS